MQSATADMIITNVETVPGRVMTQHFGLVCGSTVKSKHIGSDMMAGLKNIVGGELGGYTNLLNEARSKAVERMVEEAKAKGANAIVNVRFSTSSVAQGAAEIYVYGTAVRAEARAQQPQQQAQRPQQQPQQQRPNPVQSPVNPTAQRPPQAPQ